jgi:predicted lactoylglutathione lyase
LIAPARDPRERQDMGFLYVRTFADPDGHAFEPAWMDVAAMAEPQTEPA